MPLPSPKTPTPGFENTSNVGAALEVAMKLHGAQTAPIGPSEIAYLPEGIRAESLRNLYLEWLPFPERRSGTAGLAELDSFIAHTNRFKDEDTVVFAQRSETEPSFQSVLDYHRAGPPAVEQAARWGKHRGIHKPQVSEVWKAWRTVEGKPMSQGEFAALLEDRILDIAPPPTSEDAGGNALIAALGGRVGTQAELLAASRSLRVKENAEVTNAQILETGEVEVVYRTELREAATNQPLRLPTCFSVMGPVFEGGPAYRLWIRLRFRRVEGAIIWTLQRWRPDLIVRHAMDEMIEKVRAETGLPVLIGSPE
jgi:uncharacterized protein YfdQ (DUF2303 family)